MSLIIGMDEAGYGPNLGPLVVTVTAWKVPGEVRDCDLWRCFESVLAQEPPDDGRLHVADSKAVYTPARGLANLERSVLCALRLFGAAPRTYSTLRQFVSESVKEPGRAGPVNAATETGAARPGSLGDAPEPWFADCDLKLPHTAMDIDDDLAARWQACCLEHRIVPRAVRCEVVSPRRFNQLTRECGSKGRALTRISLRLLRSVWNPDDPRPTLIIADKHGGRNRYDELLSEVLDGQMVFRTREGRECSTYRVGATELHFQTRAECHFPVALASMVSKYVRELSMVLFNRYWAAHVPDLKPTAGYPGDARRFKEAIAERQMALGISDDVLWRER